MPGLACRVLSEQWTRLLQRAGVLPRSTDNVEGIWLAVLVFIKDSQLTLNSFFALKSVTVTFQGETLIFLFLVNPSPHLLRRSETPCLSLLESSFLLLKMTPFLCILAPVGVSCTHPHGPCLVKSICWVPAEVKGSWPRIMGALQKDPHEKNHLPSVCATSGGIPAKLCSYWIEFWGGVSPLNAFS